MIEFTPNSGNSGKSTVSVSASSVASASVQEFVVTNSKGVSVTISATYESQNVEMYYTSRDHQIVTPHITSGWGANIISNTYDTDNDIGTITFDGPVSAVPNNAFSGNTTMTTLTLPEGIESIGDGAIGNNSYLTAITLPNSLRTIGGNGLINLGLRSIIIPSGVVDIGNGGMAWMNRLTAITSYAVTAPRIYDVTFYGIRQGGTLYYPQGSDYSLWMNGTPYGIDYPLGNNGWTAVEFDPSDDRP